MFIHCKNCKYFTKLKLVLLLFSFLPCVLPAQYFFDFEKDSADQSPLPDSGRTLLGLPLRWSEFPEGRWGRSPDDPIRGEYSVCHIYDNPESGCDDLVFTHDPAEPYSPLSVSFFIRHGVPPSSSNCWQVAVLAGISDGGPGTDRISDGGPGTGRIGEGVVVGVNLTGADDLLKVWQYDDGGWQELITSSLNLQEDGMTGALLVGLELDREGSCTLSYSFGQDRDSMTVAGNGRLLHWPGGRQLVVQYRYSSARDRNLWLDDLLMEGYFREDTMAPALLDYRVEGGSRLVLEFSETPVGIDPEMFRLEKVTGEPVELLESSQEGKLVVLRFSEEIPNREELYLNFSRVCDLDGNCTGEARVLIRRNEAVWGDVVFSELMTDPQPVVGLPEEEYIELFNRSGDTVDLTGWVISVEGKDHRLDGARLWDGGVLAPGTFGILRGITLPNEGAELSLVSKSGVLIHAVDYAIPWKGPSWKQEGGWALESPDPERLCTVSSLWGYSMDLRGGTPGEVNSLDSEVDDQEPPLLLYTGVDPLRSCFTLYFSEPVRFNAWTPGHFPLMPGHILPDSIAPGIPLTDRVDLWLPEDFGQRNEFSVKLPFLVDCSGNLCADRKADGGAAPDPVPGGVVINEVMFHPLQGHPEFVELYNPGSRYQDLHQLCLDAVKEGATPGHPVPLASHSMLLPPGGYAVLAPHGEWLEEAYGLEPSGRWVGVDPWPALIDGGGMLYLTDRAGQTVDMMHFGEELHLGLIDQPEGVSLERIDPALPGSDPSNWHSAASIDGYATPGERNSQWRGQAGTGELLQIDPRVFSPDNDGFEDLLEITFRPESGGWVLTLWISDVKGNRICMLANNHVAGSGSVYRWNGEQGNGWMVPEGFYIVHAWAYHEATGRTWRERVAVGLIYR